ncbi:biotin transport system substrate-specific component [Rhodobacter sp. JA431]|uniref:biotin transporter BioY n=1 Tax=Rhodobacter sp. JA431 TaxID=570013 RepID=UPI000BCFBFB0|nr:biotin transporter BioY [Rhodobacter sp. JA431]SOC17268.1 biotin transport system substrate-specific component [Rhodobacter sp. JA431]
MSTSLSTRDIVYIALFAALTAALALFPPITIPLVGVPITAQSMGPMLAGAILGAKRGALSMVLLLALVAIGLPILAGGRGGLGVFAGPTVGFLLGWIPAAWVVGVLHELGWRKLTVIGSFTHAMIGGIIVLYAIGVPVLAVHASLPLKTALFGSAAFIPGDLIKAALTGVIAMAVKRAHPIIEVRQSQPA